MTSFFTGLGVAAFLFLVGYIARTIYEVFLYKCDVVGRFQTKSKDAWALVTGCTGGIGEGFAYELAGRGFNVLLVSRSEAKLKELATAIRAKYPRVQTEVVASDATSTDSSAIQRVVDAASGKKLTIIINNVGVSNNPSLFEHTTVPEIEDMVTVNCRYSSILTRQLVPLLKKQRQSAIVNLSSQSAFFHVPYLAVYSATKAFNLAFSDALRDELRSSNVDVLALTPGFVATSMTNMRRSLEVCDAQTCARAGLDAIGLRQTAGYWYHQLYLKVSMTIPAVVRGWLALKVMRKVSERKARLDAKKAAAALASA